MWTFEKRGYHLTAGADILIYGDIPAGSGLSSSASLEVLTGLMLRDTFGFDISMIDLALIGQYSENNFNGMNCGIMDQDVYKRQIQRYLLCRPQTFFINCSI